MSRSRPPVTVTAPATSKRSLLGRVAGVDGQEDSRQRDQKDADRNVDEEDPTPAHAVGEQTACDHPDRRRDPSDGTEGPERAIAFGAFRESHREDGEDGRRYERRPEPLQGPGADQERG
jgi:hypothetical protein